MDTNSDTRRAERPQFAKPAVRRLQTVHWTVLHRLTPPGAEPGHEQSDGLFVPGEGLGHQAQRGPQGRPVYSPDEGLT